MARSIMTTLTNPKTPELEQEYNHWYDEVHLKELAAVEGLVKATRYRLAEGLPGNSVHSYLAVYEFEGDAAEVFNRIAQHPTTKSTAVDSRGTLMAVWEPWNGSS